MITLEQLEAESSDFLTSSEVRVLILLVKASPDYNQAVGRWPSLEDTIGAFADNSATYDEAQQSKIKSLRAVITQLGALPTIVAESNGNESAQTYFSTKDNWRELALTVLDILYELPTVLGPQSFALVQRRVRDITLRDRAFSRLKY